jgi:hypothetical protein
MPDLTDAQRAVLTPALARPDRCIYPITAPLKGGAVGNIAKSLLKRGLLEERRAYDHATVWRCDDDGKPLTLRITDAGAQALSDDVVQPAERYERNVEPVVEQLPARKNGSARELLVKLLHRADGASIAEMTDATCWLPHSVRGAISGVIAKKLGHTVASAKDDVRGRVYRITG